MRATVLASSHSRTHGATGDFHTYKPTSSRSIRLIPGLMLDTRVALVTDDSNGRHTRDRRNRRHGHLEQASWGGAVRDRNVEHHAVGCRHAHGCACYAVRRHLNSERRRHCRSGGAQLDLGVWHRALRPRFERAAESSGDAERDECANEEPESDRRVDVKYPLVSVTVVETFLLRDLFRGDGPKH